MKLSDIVNGGTVSASTSVPSVPSPDAAVAAGTALFDKAYTASAGDIIGTTASAMSELSGIATGTLSDALSKASGVASAAAAGAAAGSVIPVYGTAIGAVVGAIVGIVNDVLGGQATPMEGEFRSQAERYCFPAVAASPAPDAEVETLLATQVAQPACWSDIRIRSVGYQVLFSGTDPATGQNQPAEFTFGTGWVSPPRSTPQSKSAAWYLAVAWMGANVISKAHALHPPITGAKTALQNYVMSAAAKAWTIAGSEAIAKKATALVESWYGTKFSIAWGDKHGCADVVDYDEVPGSPLGTNGMELLAREVIAGADCVNKTYPLDFTYYWSDNSIYFKGLGVQTVQGNLLVTGPKVTTGRRYIALPDTFLVGLFELAFLVASGTIPESGADTVATHFTLSMLYLDRRGRIEDIAAGWQLPLTPHPNFARVLGILAAKAKATKKKSEAAAATKKKAATALAEKTAAAKKAAAARTAAMSNTHAAPLATPVASAWGWLPELALAAAAGGLLFFFKGKQRRI